LRRAAIEGGDPELVDALDARLRLVTPEAIAVPSDDCSVRLLADSMAKLTQEGVWSASYLDHVLGYLTWNHPSAGTETLIKRMLELESDNSAVMKRLGELYKRQGRLEEAADAYRQAIAADPSDVGAQLELASVLEKQSRTERDLTLTRDAL